MIGQDFLFGELGAIDLPYHIGKLLVGGIIAGGNNDDFMNTAGQDEEITAETVCEFL